MKPSRRTFMQMVGWGGASALAGCDSATDALASLLEAQPETARPPSRDEIDLVTHVLNRITYGPRPGDRGRVAEMGVDAFIEEQLDPHRINDRRCDWKVASIESLQEPAAELYEHNARELLSDLTRYKLIRGANSSRQLFEVMVDFWTDHFNIVSEKGQCKWLKAADDRDVIRRHALGGFRDLVRASATSPAMLIYLDGHDNKVEHPGDRPNENYARELLELHTLGVHGGYTQRDVMEVARCLSGWTYENRPFRFRAVRVDFEPGRHDDAEKVVLGHRIPAGGGAEDLEQVLDIVCHHPSTARHIATKLCRFFVADPAPEAVVAQVAAAFSSSGADIRSTLRALFATPEFRGARGNLFKRPLRFVLSALRATDAKTNAGPSIMVALERMGHAPFQYPTPDGYPIEEPPWLGGLLWRWKFALALDENAMSGTSIDRQALLERLGGPRQAAAHLLGRLPSGAEWQVLRQSDRALALLIASPAFQRH